MARPIRIEFEGAVYHVTARGNERRAIFYTDEDRKLFLTTLGELVERFGVRVMAYCLMPNHYHLVIGTPRGNLSQALGWFQVTYTVRFNARHRRRGHLFQGRFKSHLVEADDYAQWLVEYLHLNPVRPRRKNQPLPPERAADLDAFPWSSHRDYAGLRPKPPEWLSLDWLAYWDTDRVASQQTYRTAIQRWFAGTRETPWTRLRGGLVLGGEALWNKVHGLMAQKQGADEARWTATQSATARRDRVRNVLANEPDDRVKIWARVKVGNERPVDLVQEFGYRDQSGIGQVIKRLEKVAAKTPTLRQHLDSIQKLASSVES